MGAHFLGGNPECWSGCSRHLEACCLFLPQQKINHNIFCCSLSRTVSLAWLTYILMMGFSSGKVHDDYETSGQDGQKNQ